MLQTYNNQVHLKFMDGNWGRVGNYPLITFPHKEKRDDSLTPNREEIVNLTFKRKFKLLKDDY